MMLIFTVYSAFQASVVRWRYVFTHHARAAATATGAQAHLLTRMSTSRRVLHAHYDDAYRIGHLERMK